jgi:hypothetical protein
MIIGVSRGKLLAGIFGVVVLASGPLLAIRPVAPANGPEYTVAALRAHVMQDPEGWLDHQVRVRARADACMASPCLNWQPTLSDPDSPDFAQPLPLTPVPSEPLLSMWRRLPVIGSLMPAPQALRWDRLAVYRIVLHAAPCGPAMRPPCYGALLLDAVPSTL